MKTEIFDPSVSMNNPDICPECGVEVPQNAAEGLCPECLLKEGLGCLAETLPSDSSDNRVESETGLPEKLRNFGDYELLEEIDRGSMGVVYRALQRSLKREVAVKMILVGRWAGPNEIKRFHSEAEAVAKLNHPNIFSIYEIGETEGRHYFSMDYVKKVATY